MIGNQKGNALIAVTLCGLVISASLSALLLGPVYIERSAVESNLLALRARWAALGDFRYALSRINHSSLCSVAATCAGTKLSDVTKASTLQGYLNEISGLQTWSYPEEASGYYIKLAPVASVDDRSGRNTYSGYLMMKGSFASSGLSSFGVLNNAATRLGAMEMRLCVGLSSNTGSCGSIGSDNGGSPTAFYSVGRLTRLPPG